MYLLLLIVIILAVGMLGVEKSYSILCFIYNLIAKRLLINNIITMGDNHSYFNIRGRFTDLEEDSFCIPSFKGMTRYKIKAVRVSPDEVSGIGLIKIGDCYIGTDVSCDILGVSKIIVWVHDSIGNKYGPEEITGNKTIRETVLCLINNHNTVNSVVKDISESNVEPTAEEQD